MWHQKRLVSGKFVSVFLREMFSIPNMTTFSGSTPISLQNCSIASGPSTSGSSVVVYCLNQVRQRLLLNPSSTLFVRLELKQKNKNIRAPDSSISSTDEKYTHTRSAVFKMWRVRQNDNYTVKQSFVNWMKKLTFPVHPCNKCNILACQFFKDNFKIPKRRKKNELTRSLVHLHIHTVFVCLFHCTPNVGQIVSDEVFCVSKFEFRLRNFSEL